MKTSKYLQFALFIFIIGATSTLFICAKNYEENNNNKPKLNPEETVDVKKIDDFSVLVVKENAKVTIVKDSLTSIHSYDKNYGVIKEHYNFKGIALKNDTLFIDEVDSKYKIHVHAKSLRNIIGLENSKIHFNTFYNDTLQVDLTRSKLTGSLKGNLIHSLKINAKNQSKINLWRTSIAIIDSITKKRKFIKQKFRFKKAEIKLTNNSTLSMIKPLKLIIEVDSLSTYRFHK